MDDLDKEIEGYVIPICRPLTREVMIMGLPRDVLIFNMCFGTFILFSLKQYYLFWLPILTHFIFGWASKTDERLCLIYLRKYIRQKKFYDI